MPTESVVDLKLVNAKAAMLLEVSVAERAPERAGGLPKLQGKLNTDALIGVL
jgi:hypothetical protein